MLLPASQSSTQSLTLPMLRLEFPFVNQAAEIRRQCVLPVSDIAIDNDVVAFNEQERDCWECRHI